MKRVSYLWPIPAIAAVLVAGGFGPVAWMVVLLTLLALWPASLVSGMVFGDRAGVAASGLAMTLVLGRALLPIPTPVLQPVVLDQRFTRIDQAARHTIRLPLGTAFWDALWDTPSQPQPQASLWFFIASDASLSRRLQVSVGDAPLGFIDRASAAPEMAWDVFGRRDWHRLWVTRTELEARETLEVVVRPDRFSSPPDGQIGLLGGFALRPTAGAQPSAFYDGRGWSGAPEALFDLSLPRSRAAGSVRPVDAYRYFVELRITHAETGRILAIYY
jgi:hypothetical protein